MKLRTTILVAIFVVNAIAGYGISPLDSARNALQDNLENISQEDKLKLILRVCIQSRDDHEVVDLSQEGLDLALAMGNSKVRAKLMRERASSLSHLGMQKEALTNYIEALSIAEEEGLVAVRSHVLNDIGLFKLNTGNINEALDYFNQSIEIKESLNDQKGIMTCWINIGYYYALKEDFGQALVYFRKALDAAKSMGLVEAMATSYANISGIYIEQNKQDSAQYYLDQSYQLFTAQNSKYYLAQYRLMYMDLHNHFGEYSLGIEKGLICLDSVRAHGFKSLELNCLKKLSELYALNNDHENANILLQEVMALKDSMHTNKEVNSYPVLLSSFEMDRKNQEIDELSGQIETKENEAESLSSTITWLWIGIIISGATLVGLLLMVRSRKHLFERKLKHKEQEMARIALEKSGKSEILKSISSDELAKQKDHVKEMITEQQQEFIFKISESYPNLSTKEIKICALIKMELSSKEIADIMNLSPNSVDTYRYQIRKKIGTTSSRSLQHILGRI